MSRRACPDLALALALALSACGGDREPAPSPSRAPSPPLDAAAEPTPDPVRLPEPPEIPSASSALPPTPSPDHNPTTREKVALGQLLFFDPRLSGSGRMSCASCHVPELGWADGKRLSTTASGALNLRHTPTLINSGYAAAWFWDGRMTTLEEQILSSWEGQMAAGPDRVAERLGEIEEYRAHFARAFGVAAPTRHRVAEALAAFVRTIRSEPSAWDRREAGDIGAVPVAAIAGFELFSDRAGCAVCHAPPLYSDNSFHAVAGKLDGGDPASRDPGRARATGQASDDGAFKTPGLRGVALTAPYFHDGSAQTLEDVIRIETRFLFPPLTDQEIASIAAFLRALSPQQALSYRRPHLPTGGALGDAGVDDAGAGATPPAPAVDSGPLPIDAAAPAILQVDAAP